MAPGAFADPPPCLKQVLVLEKSKEEVLATGGLWAIFEKSPTLRDRSVQGLKLDGKINEVVSNLRYLCETFNGVPLNELAVFVSQGVRQKGEKQFKEELLGFGKSGEEIDSWLKFSKLAQQHQKRILNLVSIQKTIHGATRYVEKYVELSQELYSKKMPLPLPAGVQELSTGITSFLSADPNMAVAIRENSQIPFWDTEENYGGS